MCEQSGGQEAEPAVLSRVDSSVPGTWELRNADSAALTADFTSARDGSEL